MLTQTMMELCGRLQMAQACESDDVDESKGRGRGRWAQVRKDFRLPWGAGAGKSSFPLRHTRYLKPHPADQHGINQLPPRRHLVVRQSRPAWHHHLLCSLQKPAMRVTRTPY